MASLGSSAATGGLSKSQKKKLKKKRAADQANLEVSVGITENKLLSFLFNLIILNRNDKNLLLLQVAYYAT